MTAAVMAASVQNAASAAAPPVAILNAKYGGGRARGSSMSKTPGAMGTTPGSYSNSFIDHAFDYPTPTSFSQLQFLSSSVASNDGADYTHRVPKVEERFCSGFFCCGVQLDDLHHLLEHFEECHVNVANGQVVIGSDSANIAVAAAAAAAVQQQGQLNGVQSSPVNGKISLNSLKSAKAALKQQQAQQLPRQSPGAINRQSSRLHQSTSANGSAASNQKRSRNHKLRSGNSALASTADDDALADDRDGDFDSDNGEDMLDGDMPQFDDFEQEEKERQAALSGATADAMASGSSSNAASPSAIPPAMSALAGQSSNPTLSAPPSPALSSYSDHPSLFRQRNKTASSASLVNMTVRKATSRSPPSPHRLNAEPPVSAFDDVGSQLHFARRARQQSVDSVASVSTNASTSSKKRSFGAAMGPGNSNNLTAGDGRGRPTSVVGLGSQMPGLDLNHMRNPSMISTPDSSRPGSPASEFDGLTYSLLNGSNGVNGGVTTNILPTMSTLSLLNANTASTALPPNQGTSAAAMSGISAATPAANLLGAGEGCLPPSLLFPAVRSNNATFEHDDDTDSMHTDEDEHDFDNESQGDYSEQGDTSYDDGMIGDDDNVPDFMRNSAAFPNIQMAMGSMHASKRKKMSSTPLQHNGFMTRQKRNAYDSNADNAAAAMFSPLTLLGANSQGGNDGQRSGYNPAAKASAATLAAIQAAAAANAFPSGSTPTGRVWIPNNAKPFKCPVPGCDKAYKQQNGLKYHRLHGHCSANSNGSQGEAVEEKDDGSDDKPFGCYVGPACGKKYKNMNGLRYHYQHSGAHGQIGLQMLANGTHPPPAYPPGHKRSASRHAFSEHAHNAATTVVMNQATAEALLASISSVGGSQSNTPNGSRSNSRPSTPRIGSSPARSRNVSPNPIHRSPTRSGSNTSVPSLSRLNGSSSGSGLYNYDEALST